MRLTVIAVGRLKDGPERELCERYRERAVLLGRSLSLIGPDIAEIPESKARRSAERQRDEAAAILSRHNGQGGQGGGLLIAFDERGQSIGSEAFSARIAAARDSGLAGASFVIGGADGLAEAIRGKADLILGFGKLTLPHQIVRVLALEQIYRAMTIVAGHPYHRA